jgi:hypothetical protein
LAMRPWAKRRRMAVQVKRRLFTVEEYYKMAKAGIIHEDDRLELIEGEIVEVSAIGSRHAGCVNGLNGTFSASGWGGVPSRSRTSSS